MIDGNYLRRTPLGKYAKEKMSLSYFMERVVIDFQFSREGDYILNLQGGSLLGIFIPNESLIEEVISSLDDNYGFKVVLE